MPTIYGSLLENMTVVDSWNHEIPLSAADPLDVLIALENVEDDEERNEMYEILFTTH